MDTSVKYKSHIKWTVLCDNRTQDETLETEHGLSIFLETDDHRLLLDTGASNVFIRNAERLGIDLGTIDYVFISHGHSDHAGGLEHLLAVNDHAKVIVSSAALTGRFYSKRKLPHSITTAWPEIPEDRLIVVDKSSSSSSQTSSCQIDDTLHIIAHIPHTHPMPQGNEHLFIKNGNDELIPDDFRHELALYVDGVLFTGCAHSGLENILTACPWPVRMVMGGFHLLDGHESEEELTTLGMTLKKDYPQTQFFTSHCTGDQAFATLQSVMGNQIQAFYCGFRANLL